jgi:hypothetical protein
MQTIIHVFSKGSKSLRDRVVNDPQLDRFELFVSEQKRSDRSPGWSKLKMKNSTGVINIEWHAASRTLICRIVTRGGKPDAIAGAFMSFLLDRCPRHFHPYTFNPKDKSRLCVLRSARLNDH